MIKKIAVYDWKEDSSARSFISRWQKKRCTIYNLDTGDDSWVLVAATKRPTQAELNQWGPGLKASKLKEIKKL